MLLILLMLVLLIGTYALMAALVRFSESIIRPRESQALKEHR
jgi:hypothetical protein